ncbi:MAG: heavy metal translocating P-type ATPase metal-binding domain-containing protein [Gilvibacter sp.]
MTSCYHCGDSCRDQTIHFKDKAFCCNGCKTVYEILESNDLCYYYDLETHPGTTKSTQEQHFEYLDNPEIVQSLISFGEPPFEVVSLLVPNIHCSSCIWVLENLSKIVPGVVQSSVNFPKKTIQVRYDTRQTSLKKVVLLLDKIGYTPNINYAQNSQEKSSNNHSLIYKLGVAGFAFGNVMFLSFPEYFDVNEFWLERFKHLFRWLMFAFSLPVVFYSAQGYFKAAFKGLKSKQLNIDVPIALGISVLFIRSTLDIFFDWGSGFFDSLTGLVFFLLIGKFFQQKTYRYLSFERDYKSYFPIAVTKLVTNLSGEVTEQETPIQHIKKDDTILIRNHEILPVDAILLNGTAHINYSFVTGEATPVIKNKGDFLYAGGRQQAGAIEVRVKKAVAQSYLTQLWSDTIPNAAKVSSFKTLTDRISKSFTITILSIATVSAIVWWFINPDMIFNVVTAVLIVACPCAIALAAPFTYGNLLRIFGKQSCYIKNTQVLEQLAQIDALVFDKTGTLTTNAKSAFTYYGHPLTVEEHTLLYNSVRASNHPLSQALYNELDRQEITTLDSYDEQIGKGIKAVKDSTTLHLGSAQFAGNTTSNLPAQTAIHINANDEYKGHYVYTASYREGLSDLFDRLDSNYKLFVLSGDNQGERSNLTQLLPESTQLHFDQKPDDKLEFISQLQKNNHDVMMIGDGLNDAGALAQSDVGMALAEDLNVFTPASDIILSAKKLNKIDAILKLAKKGRRLIYWCFAISLLYNIVGISFAVTGLLSPIVAAILMPLSSITIVVFTTLATQFYGQRILRTKEI